MSRSVIESRRATATPPTATLGDLLRRLRHERRLSRHELAQRAGVSHGSIVHYETGRSHPNPQRIPHLARALDAPEDELAQLLPPPKETTPFGRTLRELRVRRGLTQRELAAQTGCDVTVIWRYESGRGQSAPQKLGAIAAALDVPLRQLHALIPELRSPFAELLRSTRTARGLTQKRLARAVGLEEKTIAAYENANIHPGKNRLSGLVVRLAKALDLPPAQIEECLPRRRRAAAPSLLGQRLRQLRLDRGLHQRELAARCGLHKIAISKYETGKAYPPPDILRTLARKLGVAAREFAHLVPPLPTRAKPTPFGTELRRLRSQRGLTQKQLATRAGMQASTITTYEARASHPNPDALAALARALRVPRKQLAQLLPPPPTTSSLGRTIRELRQQRELTQKQLATRIGCREEAISGYERGRKHPTSANLTALARTLRVSRERLARLLPRPKTTAFGRELRQLRRRRGLTQEELATRAGCHPATISGYERGEKRPGSAGLTALARTLGTPGEQLARWKRQITR